ncbi:zinc finger, CCHC-type containing protein [Tanacetum coccineum]
MGDHQGDDCSGDLKKRLETLYMTKSLANRLYLKKKLYTFHMHPGKSQSEHIDEFHKLVGDLAAINAAISDKDQALLLLTSLPSSYDNFVETLLYGRDTMKLEDVVVTLNSRELQKMTEAKGDGGEGLYMRGRSGQNRYGAGYNHKKSQGFVRNEDQVFGSGDDGYDNADVMMAMSVEELLDWIMNSGSSYYITYKRDYLVDFKEECRVRGTGKVQVQMRDGSSFVLDNIRKIKVIKGSLVVLSGTRRANCVYTLDGQAVTRNTLKGRKQLGEYQTGWKIKTVIQQQNGFFFDYIPEIFHPHIIDFYDVRGDGNCGYRSVALGLGLSKDQWPQFRLDLVRELMAHREQYRYVFGSLGFDNIYKIVETAGAWMIMPNTWLVIASAYNRVVILLANGGSVGASAICFPLWSSPPQSQPRENIVIAHVNGDVALDENTHLLADRGIS